MNNIMKERVKFAEFLYLHFGRTAGMKWYFGIDCSYCTVYHHEGKDYEFNIG